MKIAIIGYSGSGKSTLCSIISQKYGIEKLHLDRVQFLPGWKERKLEEKLEIVGEFLDSNSDWVIDGNYSRVLQERRLEEADMIIFMSFNRFNSLYRVIRRYFKYRNKTRDSIGDGCEEKIDLDFLYWILYQGRSGEKLARYRMIQEKYPKKMHVIHNQRELDKFISSL